MGGGQLTAAHIHTLMVEEVRHVGIAVWTSWSQAQGLLVVSTCVLGAAHTLQGRGKVGVGERAERVTLGGCPQTT